MIRSASPCLLAVLFGALVACSGQSSGGISSDDGGAVPDGGDSGDGGGGGDGGSNASCTPEGAFDGAPITGTPGQWQWIPVPEAKCRNRSTTGFGMLLNPASDRLVIFVDQGGACFNALTCSANADHFGSTEFTTWQGSAVGKGIFDRSNAANPFRDYNMVFVPYCTGDVHAGNATGVNVPGLVGVPTNQSFVGYANIGHFLKRIVPTFANVKKVVLAGSSAGGFGVLLNYHRVAQAFCPRPTVLLDDSGPAMSDAYLAPCLQQRWRTLWKLGTTLPAACPECTGSDGGNLVNLTKFLARTYPSGQLGLISSNQDAVITTFFGYGKSNCSNIDVINTPLSGATFTAGLTDLRTNFLSPTPVWSSYYINSITHTYLLDGGLYSTTVNGVKLSDWVNGLVTGAVAAHVGP